MCAIVIFHAEDNRLRQPVNSGGEMCANDTSVTGCGRCDEQNERWWECVWEKTNLKSMFIYLSLNYRGKESRLVEVAGNRNLVGLIKLSSASLLNILWHGEILAEHICKRFAVWLERSADGGAIRGILGVVLDELSKPMWFFSLHQ